MNIMFVKDFQSKYQIDHYKSSLLEYLLNMHWFTYFQYIFSIGESTSNVQHFIVCEGMVNISNLFSQTF